MAGEKTSQVQETRFGQPAIFALQVGLRRCGVRGGSNLPQFLAIAPVKWQRRTLPARFR